MKGSQSLRPAWLAFGLTILLVAFVARSAFSVARERLADSFAHGQFLVSLYTARQLTDKFDLAGLCLQLMVHDDASARSPLRQFDHIELCWAVLDASPVAMLQLDRQGRVLASYPKQAETVPAEALTAAWNLARGRGRPVPAFYTTATGASRMLMVHLVDAARRGPTGGLALAVDLRTVLSPPTLTGNRGDQVEILIVRPSDLRVIAATHSLPSAVTFNQVFATRSNALFEQMRRGAGGREPNAYRRGAVGERQVPYLIGVQGLKLGGEPLSVAAVVSRRSVVEGYLGGLVTWILLVAGVAGLGVVSFIAMLLQSQAAAREERRRSEERNSLLQISQALLSERRLQEVLSRIADESRELFRAEGATIALVDDATDEIVFRYVSSRDAQVAKHLLGLRLPRSQGVLGWVVTRGEAVLVNDTSKDPRFSTSVDQQTGVQTMSLLCAPLRDQKGSCFGAIELVSHVERPFPDSDLVLLQSLAVTASAAVERAMFMEREVEQQRLQREMEIARTVQQGLLPRTFPSAEGFDLCGASDPAREVGGDFFDFIPISDRHLGVVIADVADKGLGAAMFMVMCRSLLYSCASRELSPAKVLAELNAKILEVSTADLFVTVFYGVLDTADQSFRYTNAGHNPPLWYHAQDGTVSNITVPGIALGVIDDMDLGEAELKLGPGDRLVLYTDGVTEAIDAGEHQFGLPRLTAVVADGAADSPETVKAIQAAVNTFVGGQPQFDDMTLAVVHAAAEGPSMVDLLREIQARG